MTELKRTVRVIDIPYGKSAQSIEAAADECAQIAARLQLEAVTTFAASFVLSRAENSPIISVEGSLTSDIRQLCVVTLEPFDSAVSEAFSASFTTERPASDVGQEIFVDAASDDEPEPISGGRIELGELAVQMLSLSLDPYPRRPDLPPVEQVFGAPTSPDDDGDPTGGMSDKPFAALERWKRRP
ncbi:MAG: DUF177 domain-containing protein [Pseudomonadota bacterium]